MIPLLLKGSDFSYLITHLARSACKRIIYFLLCIRKADACLAGRHHRFNKIPDLLSVYDSQRNCRSHCRLPGEQGREYLFPYRSGFLSCGSQSFVFLSCRCQCIGKHGDVVGDSQEEHLRPHGEGRQLTGNLLHAHLHIVELGSRIVT